MAMPLFLLSAKQSLDISAHVKDANDFDTVFQWPIEDQIFLETANVPDSHSGELAS